MRKVFATLPSLTTEVLDPCFKGYDLRVVERFLANPMIHTHSLIDISRYMYDSNGWFRQYVELHVKPCLYRWTINTEIKDPRYKSERQKRTQDNLINFIAKINRLNLEHELHNILTKCMLEDAVFAFWVEDNAGSSLFYLPWRWCTIRKEQRGMWSYSLDIHKIPSNKIASLPQDLQDIITAHKAVENYGPFVDIPYEKQFCIKYNNHYSYVFPPCLDLILA